MCAPEYMAWIRTLPCAICGDAAPNEAHHAGPRAFGTKASDWSCIPLCRRCHYDGHSRVGMRAFLAPLNLPALIARLNHAWSLINCHTTK